MRPPILNRAETEEFSEFYAATFHRVAGQLYAYLGDHAEAQDLTQEAFCRALDRWSRIGRYENPAAWVRQVAWNLATSRLRHLQVVHRFLAAQRQEHVPPPQPERLDLTRALAALPANHRLAVVLHYVGQLSAVEIAQQRGVAVGTVRSWLSRGRAQLAEQLIDWDQAAAATKVAPEGGLASAVAEVRRRRNTRRAIIATVLALLVVIPLAILLRSLGTEPPIIEPTPQPSPTPSPTPTPTTAVNLDPDSVESRRITLPAANGQLTFVDRDHAWFWNDPCSGGASKANCRTLTTTADGGKTWHKVNVPAIPNGATTTFLPYAADTATIQISPRPDEAPSNYWHTTDGGASFSSLPGNRPPVEAVMSNHPGLYQVMCPGAIGLEDVNWTITCERRQLVKLGVGPVDPQPPVQTPLAGVVEGGDGRLWLHGAHRLFVSNDHALTWQELPWPSGVDGTPLLSPDGKQVWLSEMRSPLPYAYWELVGTQWVERFTVPIAEVGPILLGDGLWLLGHDGTMAYYQDGVYTAIDGLPVEGGEIHVLRDGTIAVYTGTDILLGTGSGRHHQWVRVTK